jgi:serine/threonine protein phosphatase PrpC
MGATLVAAFVRDGDLYTAEVGDSRAYVLRSGKLTQISKDQTYVQTLLESGVLTPETAKTFGAKNVILQAMGQSPSLVVAMHRLALRKGDRILLCSDGLSGLVADEEIHAILNADKHLDEAGDDLVAKANENGGTDTVTVVLADIMSDTLPAASDGGELGNTLTLVRDFTTRRSEAPPG